MNEIVNSVDTWIAAARDKLAQGALSDSDLDSLAAAVRGQGVVRQRLLYLHASTPSIRSPLAGAAVHDATPGSPSGMDPLNPDMPYASVHEAVLDGWRIIHFPQQLAPFDDREIDVIGYEFVLEKLEVHAVSESAPQPANA